MLLHQLLSEACGTSARDTNLGRVWQKVKMYYGLGLGLGLDTAHVTVDSVRLQWPSQSRHAQQRADTRWCMWEATHVLWEEAMK